MGQISNFWRNFNRWTSVHGLNVSGRIIPQNTWLSHLFELCFLFAFIAFCIQIALLVRQYNDREVETSVIMEFKSLVFPSVTICNLNPYKKSALYNSRELTELMAGFNFVTQLQNLKVAKNKRKRKKREASESCAAHSRTSSYANKWSEEQSLEHLYTTCPQQFSHNSQFCIEACGPRQVSLCIPVTEDKCLNNHSAMEEASMHIDRIFRQCLETDTCFNDTKCNDYGTADACMMSVRECANVNGSLCLDPVRKACAIAMQSCNNNQQGLQCLKHDRTIPINITLPLKVMPTPSPTSALVAQAIAEIYRPPPPPPPPGVLPPVPQYPPPPPGAPPKSEDPWVPPAPPPNPFEEPPFVPDPNNPELTAPPPKPPAPPLDFNVLGLLSSNSSDALELIDQLTNLAEEMEIDVDSSTSQVFMDVQMQMVQIVSDLTSSQRQALGSSDMELIVNCNFDSVPCNISRDFQPFEDADYGNCYTYNFDSSVISKRPGNNYGLQMIVMSNVSEYLFSTQQTGARVTVHPPGTVPFPAVQGYSISAGTSTQFKVRYSEFKRQKPPYGHCTEVKNTNYHYQGGYTYEGCYRSCLQDFILERCGCGDPRFALPQTLPAMGFCKRTNFVQNDCLENVIASEMNAVSETCECTLPCWEQSYVVAPGTSAWPSNPKFKSASGLCTPSVLKATGLTCQQLFQRNALKIEVFYDYFNYEVVIEKPLMSRQNLWNQASGAGGFWFSLSFVSTTEIVIVLVQLVLYVVGLGRLPYPIPTAGTSE